jgi:hypothetical protein
MLFYERRPYFCSYYSSLSRCLLFTFEEWPHRALTPGALEVIGRNSQRKSAIELTCLQNVAETLGSRGRNRKTGNAKMRLEPLGDSPPRPRDLLDDLVQHDINIV